MVTRWQLVSAMAACGVGLAVEGPHASAQAVLPNPIPLPSLAPLVNQVSPAVVNVQVVMNALETVSDSGAQPGAAPGPGDTPLDEFLRRFFEDQGGMPEGLGRPRPRRPGGGHPMALGSGFLIDPSGYVVTNNHVVGHAETVTVVFQDNSRHPARIIGTDQQTDVALLKIDAAKPLPYVTWGDSRTAQVGDWVVAVGNPFGLGGTVTAGIISALGRDIQSGPYDDFLQIDAPINRGNSGGPTFDLSGRVIGINTAIYSPSGGSVGIGFAVPASMARTVVQQLRDQGHVSRGWLGVQIQGITPEIARGFGLDADNPKGALVAQVTPDSPAAKAGLQEGDVITALDGKPVNSVHDLPRLVAEMSAGRPITLTVLRNGKPQEVTATVAEMPARAMLASAGNPPAGRPQAGRTSELGLQLAPLTDDVRSLVGLPPDVNGVLVRDVAQDSPAAGILEPGDVIVAVNQQRVADPAAAAAALRDAAAKKQAVLLVNRQGVNRFVGLPLSESQG